MNKKDLFAPIAGIIIGLVLIISPFLAHVKKSLILLGIVPLWIGAYYIYHLSNNTSFNPPPVKFYGGGVKGGVIR